MTALEKVLEQHPVVDADRIVEEDCPYEYGVGIPSKKCWKKEQGDNTCRECWNQEYKGEIE